MQYSSKYSVVHVYVPKYSSVCVRPGCILQLWRDKINKTSSPEFSASVRTYVHVYRGWYTPEYTFQRVHVRIGEDIAPALAERGRAMAAMAVMVQYCAVPPRGNRSSLGHELIRTSTCTYVLEYVRTHVRTQRTCTFTQVRFHYLVPRTQVHERKADLSWQSNWHHQSGGGQTQHTVVVVIPASHPSTTPTSPVPP
jgi:hypothetical protein